MRSLALAICLALVASLPVQADLYWCRKDGTSSLVEKQISGAKCRLVDSSPPVSKSSSTSKAAPKAKKKASATAANFPKVAATEQRRRDLTRRQILQHELAQEQRKLNLAQKVLRGPSGNEEKVSREYKYRSTRHKQNIIALEQELERLN